VASACWTRWTTVRATCPAAAVLVLADRDEVGGRDLVSVLDAAGGVLLTADPDLDDGRPEWDDDAVPTSERWDGGNTAASAR